MLESPEQRLAAGKPREGTIVLSARHEENQIVISITDDGQGIDPERLRPSDVPILLGDASKFTAATGRRPQIPIEQTLADLLDYWRLKLGASRPKKLRLVA